MNHIIVQVAGYTGVGKSTVAVIIQDALRDHGISATVEDDDTSISLSGQFAKRYESVAEQTSVIIKTLQLNRSSL